MSIHKCLQWPWLQYRATSSALGSYSGFTLPWVLLDTLPMAGAGSSCFLSLPLLLLLDLAGSTPKAKVSLLSLDELLQTVFSVFQEAPPGTSRLS